MPSIVVYKKKTFSFLRNKLQNLGFRMLSQKEVDTIFKTLDFKEPRNQETDPRKNIPFQFESNYLKIIVWTSFHRDTYTTTSGHCAWVIVQLGDVRIWSSPQIRRTKNFLARLIHWVTIMKVFAENRPLCKKCSKRMQKTLDKKGNRKWVCVQIDQHTNHRKVYNSWNYFKQFLAPEQKKFFNKWEEEQRVYLKWRKDSGLRVHKIGSTRNSWEVQKPENLVSVV